MHIQRRDAETESASRKQSQNSNASNGQRGLSCQPDTESPPNVTQPARVQVQYTQVRIPFDMSELSMVELSMVGCIEKRTAEADRTDSLVQRLNYRRPGRNYVEKTGVKTDTKVDEYKLIP